MTPFRTGLLTTALAFTFYAFAINFSLHGWRDWYAISSAGRQTIATVTGVQSENHGRCYFQFTTNSKPYSSWDDGCSYRNIGDHLPITYLPSDPSFATTSDPKDQLMFITIGPLLLSSIVGAIAAWQKSRKLRGLKDLRDIKII